jgi:tetraacyldisaccharide 4'-kinase
VTIPEADRFPIVGMPGRWPEELPGSPWRWLLAPAWAAYASGVVLRNLAYDRGWRRIERIDAPVLSVGNIVAGGAGKTPAALALARLLREQGRRPTVVARGYRGVDGVNDEARLAPDLPTVCDPDRVRGARHALAEGADCVVLDDGMQHRRLHRDLDLVVIDATRPWGDPAGGPGALLPLGWRRDTLASLDRCQVAWISRGHLLPGRVTAITEALRQRGLQVVREAAPERRLVGLRDGQAATASGPVLLASGLGNPLGFELDAQQMGLQIAASLRFPDHHHYTAADVGRVLDRCADRPVVVTAKDAVKLTALWPQQAPPCLVLHATTRLEPADQPVLAAAVAAALAPGRR